MSSKLSDSTTNNDVDSDAMLIRYQQSLATARQTGDCTREGTTLYDIGVFYQGRGQPKVALYAYQQVLAISREMGDRSSEGTTLNHIGSVYDALGQTDKALDTFQQTLTIRREVCDRSGEGVTLNNIGAIYNARGQMQAALDNFQQALAISREAHDREVGDAPAKASSSIISAKSIARVVRCRRRSIPSSKRLPFTTRLAIV